MLEALKGWVMNICTAIFFITAVEMILPSNSLKKYTKFVLGLILITVLIKPIIRLYDHQLSMDNYLNAATEYFEGKQYEKNYDKYKNKNINSTKEVFASNLETLCAQKLKEKFPKNNYKVTAKVTFDDKSQKFIVDGIRVWINEGSVKKIKKVDIESSKEVNNKETENDKNQYIVDYLSQTIDIPKDKITVYDM